MKLFPVQRQFSRLLLYLEWILLGITALTQVLPTPINQFAPSPPASLVVLVGMGLMGLWLPQRRRDKLLYTAAEFGLLLLPIVLSQSFFGFFPLLYLVVVMRSCAMFQPIGRIVVAGLVFVAFVVIISLETQTVIPLHAPLHPPLRLGPPPTALSGPPLTEEQPLSLAISEPAILYLKVNAALSFGLMIIFVLMLVTALLAERQSREKLTIANEQLRQYALQIENQATLQERNRIAREIHDSLGHLLTAQSIQLENALVFLPPDAARTQSFLAEARRLGSNALQEVRQSVATLRSDPLKGQSLEAAIADATADFQQATGIAPDVMTCITSPLPAEISTATYRIVQEAFTNICKHAAATHVSLRLWEKADGLHLLVEDNGDGFSPHQNTTGFGLKGMRERTQVLGGQFSIASQPGRGCQIAAVIPLSRH